MESIKPPFRWVGGKTRMLSTLIAKKPIEYNRYFEPFIGAGSLLFEVKPRRAIVGDLNPELMCFYRSIRDDLDSVLEYLEIFQELDFYEVRSMDRLPEFEELEDEARGARFLFLQLNGFNGLWRTNRRGENNTPIGDKKRQLSEKDVQNLRVIGEYLRGNISLRCRDYRELLSDARSGDWVYLDPPYWETFTGYDREGWGQQQQELLQECLDLDHKGVKVLLSQKDSADVRMFFAKYPKFSIAATGTAMTVAANPSDRGKRSELLIKNY